MTFEPPRVYVHDGAGVRLCELVDAVGKRSFRTMQVSRASFVILETDPQLRLCDPREGRLLVIESGLYPYTWAGQIVSLEGGPQAGTITVEARSYEGILQERYLPTDFVGSGTSGQQFAAMWSAVERENPTGVSLSNDLAAGEPFDDTAYGDRSLFDAWNLAAGQTGHEWWLEHAVSQGVLTTQAQFRPQRGQDRTRDVRLVVGPHANCRVNRWRMSSEGGTHRIRAVAGAASVTQGFTERSRVERRSGKAPVSTAVLTQRANTRHGYTFAAWPQGDTPLTRGEQLAIMENIRSAGPLAIAAESILARGRTAQRMVDVEVQAHPEVWPYCTPGDVITLTLPEPYFVDGFDGPVAIVDVEASEELGTMRLNLMVPAA